MKIGIIGAGGIGKAFASQAVKAGYEVILSNSRGPESLSEVVKKLGPNSQAGTVQDAAKADIIFLSVIWNNIESAVSQVSTWEGRIVIDANNPVLAPDWEVADLKGKTSSEVIEGWLPGALIVKAFNTLPAKAISSDPLFRNGKRVFFYSGNDMSAKMKVAGVIDKMGFAGIDLGGLSDGGKMQQYPGGPLAGLNLLKVD